MGFVGSGKPIKDPNLMEDGELHGQYRGRDVALGRLGKQLACGDNQNNLLNWVLDYRTFRVMATKICIWNARREIKLVSSNINPLEVRRSRVPYHLCQI